MSTDPTIPLHLALDERQEKFAQLVAAGTPQTTAAREAGYGKGSERSLKRNARVQARIIALRAKPGSRGEDPAALSIADKRRYLAGLILNPSDEVKIADKLRAIELDSKLANHFLGKDGEETPPKPAPGSITLEEIQDIARRVKIVSPLLWKC